jgi:hypothetical protein
MNWQQRAWFRILSLTGLLVAGIASAHDQPDARTPTAQIRAASQEDSTGWNCTTMGNHVCGPTNTEGLRAGCYDDGVLVIPWTRYDNPKADPLYGRLTSPCKGVAPTQEQESDAAYAAAQH